MCNPKTSNVTCASEEEMNFFLDGTMMSLNHIDKQYDPSDYENPVKIYFNDYWTRFSKKFFTSIVFNFKTVTFFDDIGLFFQDIQIHEYIAVENIKTSIDLQPNDYSILNQIK